MDKSYEIIQNISLSESKVEDNQAPQEVEAAAEVAVTPAEETPVETPIEIENSVVPEEESNGQEISANIEMPSIDIPSIELPPEISVDVNSDTEVATEAEVSNDIQPESSYDFNNTVGNTDYSNMFNNNVDNVSPAYGDDNYEVSSTFNSSYEDSTSGVELDIDYKDENSINRYYDQKIKDTVNQVEKERSAALDQCKRYNEMSTWVNEIGSSFNFFKGRSGY